MANIDASDAAAQRYAVAIHRHDTIQLAIEGRHAALAKAIMSGDVDTFVSFYSDDIEFRDWTHNSHLVGIKELRDFFENIFTRLAPITIRDATISCTSPEFVAWEFEKRFTVVAPMPHLDRKVGQKIKKRAVLVQHWRLEKDSQGKVVWKIWKENDYGQRDQEDV